MIHAAAVARVEEGDSGSRWVWRENKEVSQDDAEEELLNEQIGEA